jgi:branched-chain amino acid aminotransferase
VLKEIKSEMNAFETLLISRDGKILNAANLISFYKKNTVFTTLRRVLPGITRNYVISLCHKLSIQIQEKDIYYTDLEYFDSVFISGTSIGILIVSAIDEFQFSINKILLISSH